MKILIIKTGRSETFDLFPAHPHVISLGDVVRSTVLLHLFLGHEVHWLTSPNAKDLIEFIPEIQTVFFNVSTINFTDYELVINLERDTEIIQWVSKLSREKLIGFIDEESLKLFSGIILLSEWLKNIEALKMNWSEKLFLLLDKKWDHQNYYLPKKSLIPELENRHCIGLNWKVGVKWPTKTWPMERWHQLEARFSSDFNVSWQEGFEDLVQYMNWINSCKVLVTHDSLGLHIARALNKQIVAMFGPTSSTDSFLGANGNALSAEGVSGFTCLPCYKDQCHNNIHCMSYLSVDLVADRLNNILRQA